MPINYDNYLLSSYKHMHLRLNSESAAFYRCGSTENVKLDQKLESLFFSQRKLNSRQFFLSCGFRFEILRGIGHTIMTTVMILATMIVIDWLIEDDDDFNIDNHDSDDYNDDVFVVADDLHRFFFSVGPFRQLLRQHPQLHRHRGSHLPRNLRRLGSIGSKCSHQQGDGSFNNFDHN